MRKVAAASTALVALLATLSATAQIGVNRKILIQEDIDIPGYQVLLVEVTIDVGGREGRHRHAGTLLAQVTQGELTLELEGKATQVYGPGDSVIIRPGQIHEGINTGDEPVIALASFVVPTDEPLTTQVD